jgi:hypothetical protein
VVLTGTIINFIAILIGGSLGLVLGARVPLRLRQTIVAGMGLFVLALGIQMSLKSNQFLIVLGGLIIGGSIGEWLRIEDRLTSLGAWLEARFNNFSRRMKKPAVDPAQSNPTEPSPNPSESAADSPDLTQPTTRFIRGFLAASLLFAIGPIAILGSIQDGLTGDYSLLAIKSVLDGFAALAFAASLGVGVLFSSLVILVYQGSLSLLAAQAQAVITPAMMAELTATGGVLLIGISFSNLLEIKPIRVANFLPALLVSPLIVALLAYFGRLK